MEAVVGIWNQFEVDMRQNKQGKLEVFITGPGKPDTNINKQSNGIALVKYLPSVSGEYYITVLVDGALIPGCPFKPIFGGEKMPQYCVYLFYGNDLFVNMYDYVL